jgi:acetyl-CoA carboxylase carboxyltransferase component
MSSMGITQISAIMGSCAGGAYLSWWRGIIVEGTEVFSLPEAIW